MSTGILIALLALIFFAQIFTWRKADAAATSASDASAFARKAAEYSAMAESFARRSRDMTSELTADGSPLMRAIAALPRKRKAKVTP